MGGRGAKSKRTVPYFAGTSAALAREGVAIGGGGGNTGVTSGGAGSASLADIGDVNKLEVVKMSWNGPTHKAASNKYGSITVKDEFGNLHTSNLASAGSARITYEFKDFVLKFEGFHSSYNQGQNATEIRAYNNLSKSDKKYVPKPLGENKIITLNYNGSVKTGQMIAIERAIPLNRKLTRAEYDNVVRKYNAFKYRNGVTDMDKPDFNAPDGYYGKIHVGHNSM